jgi:hypothetical protein
VPAFSLLGELRAILRAEHAAPDVLYLLGWEEAMNPRQDGNLGPDQMQRLQALGRDDFLPHGVGNASGWHLRMELAPFGIEVTELVPGGVEGTVKLIGGLIVRVLGMARTTGVPAGSRDSIVLMVTPAQSDTTSVLGRSVGAIDVSTCALSRGFTASTATS